MNKKFISPETPATEEDSRLFRQAMQNVKPLITTKLKLPTNVPFSNRPKHSLKKPEELQETILFPFSDYESLLPASQNDTLEFARSGIQDKVLRKLRRGQYNARAILDLHGKTTLEAHKSLGYFLLTCQKKKVQHVLIIHGKGRSHNHPILKNKLNHWLRQTDQVLAFCSATHKDGSSGALYVLLRR